MDQLKKQKRKQQPSNASQAPQKRQKSGIVKTAPKKRSVAVSKLPWKKVDVPEMFDDAEGFYGLEVIEGVDIVKKGDQVEFVSIRPPGSNPNHG